MSPENSISEHQLQAWHDGELDAAQRLRVEAWIASHPDAAARLRSYRDIDQRLHQRFDPVLAEQASASGATRPYPRPRQRIEWLPGLAAAAGIGALMLMAGLIGWSLHPATGNAPQLASGQPAQGVAPPASEARIQTDLFHPALFAHQVYATDSQRPVEVPALQRASLNQWVSRRMHTPLQAPDLSTHGLRLIGGRLLPSSNRMAAQFMYDDSNGNRTTVYVRRISGGGHSDFQYREQDALNAFYWVDEAMGYAVIGEQPAAELIDVAATVQQRFAGSGKGAGEHL